MPSVVAATNWNGLDRGSEKFGSRVEGFRLIFFFFIVFCRLENEIRGEANERRMGPADEFSRGDSERVSTRDGSEEDVRMSFLCQEFDLPCQNCMSTLFCFREINKSIAEENLRLAEQHKSRQEYLNQVLYKNKPTAEFFEQFNRDAR